MISCFPVQNIKEKNFVVAKDTSSFAKANLMAKIFSLIFFVVSKQFFIALNKTAFKKIDL